MLLLLEGENHPLIIRRTRVPELQPPVSAIGSAGTISLHTLYAGISIPPSVMIGELSSGVCTTALARTTLRQSCQGRTRGTLTAAPHVVGA